MSHSEIHVVRIFLGVEGRPSIDRPHLHIHWDRHGEIWFEIQDSADVFASPGIQFQAGAPYTPLPDPEPQRIKFSFDNDDQNLTGIPFHYTVNIVGWRGPIYVDPTVQNDPPGTPPVP